MDETIRVQSGSLTVEGKFLRLRARDMEVEITFPYRGVSRGLNLMIVPWAGFASRLYAKGRQLTPRGKAVAEGLLMDIYKSCWDAEQDEER